MMKVEAVIFHDEAKTEYKEAFLWYEEKADGLGYKFLAAVRIKLTSIAANPELYSRKLRKEYREAIVDGFPYMIIYQVYPKENRIFVSSIHHQNKKPTKKYRK